MQHTACFLLLSGGLSPGSLSTTATVAEISVERDDTTGTEGAKIRASASSEEINATFLACHIEYQTCDGLFKFVFNVCLINRYQAPSPCFKSQKV